MRRIFWDMMLIIYLLEGHPTYTPRVLELLKVSLRRRDQLYTSFLGLGEVLAGAAKSRGSETGNAIREQLTDIGFSYLAFDAAAVDGFASLRAVQRVKPADAIHLACAGAVGVDLFLTGDKDLMKLQVSGIKFIAALDTPLLQL